ncbi:MAG: hypothetical protein L3K19_04145, partial [Thermoplasmata archaeon]|nr:hypothetical protein [Thermoplasmata archaeon]
DASDARSSMNRATFRGRPELLLGITLLGFLAVNLVPGPSSVGLFARSFTWALLTGPAGGGQGPIFPVTWTCAWLSFALALLYLRRGTSLGWLRALAVAAGVPFGATGVFEIAYQITGVLVQPVPFAHAPLQWAWLASWTSLGAVTLPFWRLDRRWAWVATTFGAGFVLWGIAGFPQVTWGNVTQVPEAYAFNVPLKVLAFVLMLLPVLVGLRRTGVPALALESDLAPTRVTSFRGEEGR